MACRENLVLADVFLLSVLHSQLLQIQVRLFVVPLNLYHRLARLLFASTLLDDTQDPANNRAFLSLTEEGELSEAVNDSTEHEFLVDRPLLGLLLWLGCGLFGAVQVLVDRLALR